MKQRTEKQAKTPQQALSALMRLAARAEKSTGDARRLMWSWGVEKGEHDAIVERLVREKFIDDERFATAYVREKLKLSGWGVRKIRAALAAKGVARDVVDRVLETLADGGEIDAGETAARLEKQMARKAAAVKAEAPRQRREKLVRYGMSLGYDYDDVAAAIEKIFSNGS